MLQQAAALQEHVAFMLSNFIRIGGYRLEKCSLSCYFILRITSTTIFHPGSTFQFIILTVATKGLRVPVARWYSIFYSCAVAGMKYEGSF